MLPVLKMLALLAVQDVLVDAQVPADLTDPLASLQNELHRVTAELLVEDSGLRVLRQNMPPCLILGQTFQHVHDIGEGPSRKSSRSCLDMTEPPLGSRDISNLERQSTYKLNIPLKQSTFKGNGTISRTLP